MAWCSMFQKLVNHNDDLRRLVEKGYAVGFDSHCLIIRDVPYLDVEGNRKIGAIVTKMVDVDGTKVRQEDHQIFFAGGTPHGLDGQPIPNLGGGACGFPLSRAAADVIVERSFSNKPQKTGSFQDFFEKIESYVNIVSGPARIDKEPHPFTRRTVEDVHDDGIFKINDTMTSRAGLTDMTEEFRDEVIAIIGLGGTGAYILDKVVRTPVAEIRGFDDDFFHVHTAFRSPGAFAPSEFGHKKVDVYQARYENLRNGINLQAKYIDASCAKDLKGVTFAFVCVDSGFARKEIFDLLISLGIPFIDVGMGLTRRNDQLGGQIRTTLYGNGMAQEVRDQHLANEADAPDDVYKTNIQIGELNDLNACQAVIMYKQYRSFYRYDRPVYQTVFDIGGLKLFCMAGGENEGEDEQDASPQAANDDKGDTAA